jgi:ABC-2 type transport system ATP-binding protein
MTEREACIEVKGLSKTYKRGRVKALDGVDLTVFSGEVFGLIGPNGAGKTTLLGCLLGLLRPDAGSVTVGGKPPDFLSVRRVTGYMPERPDFESWMTALQFLRYHHMLADVDKEARERNIQEALALVELDPAAWSRRLGTYSRGMLQRLNLAQALVARPTIMLLDEPTLGLDPPGIALVRRIVIRLREEKCTAIVNSHQLDEIERVCDRVAFIRGGKIRSIENLKLGQSGEYALLVRWLPGNESDGVAETVSSAAARAGCQVKECGRQWCRFLVRDGLVAAAVIRELIEAGLPLHEAVSERTRLEQLFEQSDGGLDDE